MVRSLWDLEEELLRRFDELWQELGAVSGFAPSIRTARAAFPAINIGATDEAVYLYAFAPGIDPKGVEITLEENVLTLSGERQLSEPEGVQTVYLKERYQGPFRRVVALPEDIDPDRVSATYRNGLLIIEVGRKGAVRPKKIEVKS